MVGGGSFISPVIIGKVWTTAGQGEENIFPGLAPNQFVQLKVKVKGITIYEHNAHNDHKLFLESWLSLPVAILGGVVRRRGSNVGHSVFAAPSRERRRHGLSPQMEEGGRWKKNGIRVAGPNDIFLSQSNSPI